MCLTLIAIVLFLLLSSTHGQSPFSTRSRLKGLQNHGNKRRYSGDLAAPMTISSIYTFNGGLGQFAEFPVWYPAQDDAPSPGSQMHTTLQFQFQTKSPKSFLVYLDDVGSTRCISITLADGRIDLLYKFGKTNRLKAGFNLNDNNWHTVVVERKLPFIILTVDRKSSKGRIGENHLTRFVPSTSTYFGGLPQHYRLSLLAIPGIIKQNKFIGNIQNIKMNEHYVTHLQKKGVWEEDQHACMNSRNPCRNNGVCYLSSQNHALCDCSFTNYTGKYCDEAPTDAVATFGGSQWLSYDLSTNRVYSADDEITLSFLTHYPDGLLLYTGKSADFVALSLVNGNLVTVVDLGSGSYEMVLESESGGFNDGEWHSVKVNRSLEKVDIIVDQANIHHGYIQRDYTMLSLNDVMYVGGSPSTSTLPGSRVKKNFIGCLKEVTYANSKDRRILISRWARNHDRKVSVHGNVTFACSTTDLTGPVNFAKPSSWLTIMTKNNARKGSIEFDFKTTEPNGLLLYANSTASDLLAIELYNNQINVIFNLGSGTSRFRIQTSGGFCDGKWHSINVARKGKNATIMIDGNVQRHTITGSNRNLDLTGKVFVGGVDFGNPFRPLTSLWTAPMREGFVGCLKNFRKDGQSFNIQSLAKSRLSTSSTSSPDLISPYCNRGGKSQCISSPCQHGGVCVEGMNRYICDCSNTSFAGANCEEAVVISRFNGSQVMNFPMDSTVQTAGEEISLRFKTIISSGILLAATSNRSKDSLIIQLVKGGKVQLRIDIGQGPDLLLEGSGLHDRQWHTVKVSRRGLWVSLDVDGRRKAKSLSGNYNKLEFDVIHLAGIVTSAENNILNTSTGMMASRTNLFVGHLENVIFNTVQLIDRCFENSIMCNNNGTLGDLSVAVAYPVTFYHDNSYVVLPTLQGYNSTDLVLSLKTTVENGLILYNGGRHGDYIAIEIMDGLLYYSYNIGNGYKMLTIPGAYTINDNIWHDIRITRTTENSHTLYVDKRSVDSRGSEKLKNLDLDGYLYIGGVRQHMFFNDSLPKSIMARVGFQGCLGNLHLNGKISDIAGPDKIRLVGSVTKGCSGPFQTCTPASCRNGGICLQKWNDFVCDCSITTFVGDRCQERATAYLFGSNTGLMLYRWLNNFPSSGADKIALGLTTTQRNALLMRVVGSAETELTDFLELKIVNGRLTLRFNLGETEDIVLEEPTSISDGQYHKCIVNRNGADAYLTVDENPTREYRGSGAARGRFETVQGSISVSARPSVLQWLRNKGDAKRVFNTQSTILIGGMLDLDLISRDDVFVTKRTPTITQAFRGQMAGLFYNNIKLFDQAANGDSQVQIIGEVELIESPSTSTTIPTTNRPTTTMATLTIFSTTKSTESDNLPNINTDCKDSNLELCPNPPGQRNSTTEWGSSIIDNKTPERPSLKSSPQTRKQNVNINSTYSPDDPSLFTEINTGSVPIVVGKAAPLSIAMIIGIAAAAVCCVIILMFIMYRCRNRDTVYNVTKQEQTNGMTEKTKHLHVNVRGQIVSNKPDIKTQSPDKEVYV